MAYQSKYFSPQQLETFLQETEQEIDRREFQRAEEQRLQQIIAFINNPANKSIIDADPMVQKLRALPQRPQPQAPGQRPAVAAPQPAPQYKSRAQLEQERPWLAPHKPGSYGKAIDPYVR